MVDASPDVAAGGAGALESAEAVVLGVGAASPLALAAAAFLPRPRAPRLVGAVGASAAVAGAASSAFCSADSNRARLRPAGASDDAVVGGAVEAAGAATVFDAANGCTGIVVATGEVFVVATGAAAAPVVEA